jgi:uncharacterized membrane protein
VDLALAVAVILAAAVRQEVGSQLVLITMLQKFKRILTHLWLDESDTRRAIPADMLARLTALVVANELRHSGELRIFVEAGLPASYLWRGAPPRERALTLFGNLRVWDTEHNNGVLIYLLLADKAIEIVADRGLNQHVSAPQWRAMMDKLGVALHEGLFEDGLTQALDALSAVLVAHFPATDNAANANELPDHPVLG